MAHAVAHETSFSGPEPQHVLGRSGQDSRQRCKAADVTIKISFVTRLIRNRPLSMDSRPATMIGRPGFCGGGWAVAGPALIAVIARGGDCGLNWLKISGLWVFGFVLELCFLNAGINSCLRSPNMTGTCPGTGDRGVPLPRQPREMFFRGAMPVTHVRRP